MSPGIFRLTLASIVLLHHTFPIRLGAVAVGLFFVLSGFWVSRMWRTKYSNMQRPIRAFLSSRWIRLAPVFFSVHILALAILPVINPASGEVALNVPWWISQLTIVGSSQFGRLLPPVWSLDVEMQFYIALPILMLALAALMRQSERTVRIAEDGARRNESGSRWLWLSLIATMFTWSALRLTTTATFETPMLDVYLWMFAIGSWWDRVDKEPSDSLQRMSAIVTLALICGAFALPLTRELVWRTGNQQIRLTEASHICFTFSLILFFIPFALGTVFRQSGASDRWLGDLSYPLYLFHWIPRDWYYTTIGDQPHGLWTLAMLFLCWIASYAGAIVILQYIDRPIRHRLERMFGKHALARQQLASRSI